MTPTASQPHALAAYYRRLLLEDILPWWLKHAVDRTHGGLCTCIRDDGTLISQDKYIWSQVRALWTFAAAWNRLHHNETYLAVADDLFDKLRRHGRTADGDWLFLASRDWQPKEGATSIQTDAYAICALVEYCRARGNEEALAIARHSYERSWQKIRHPGSYETAPYPIPAGTKAQRVSMQFSLAYWELYKLTGEAAVKQAAVTLTDDVLDHFRRPDLNVVVEYLQLDNTLADPPIGTYYSPGHGIETAWFQLENLRHTQDHARMTRAAEILRWCLERGWDEQYGGLFLGADLEGGTPFLPHADKKIWWPHCEAICGTLMAYEITGDTFYLDWHDRILSWSLAHFALPEHGEWQQRLNRDGTATDETVALPVKDPFHLPRAILYAIESLDRITASHRMSTASADTESTASRSIERNDDDH